MRGRGPSRPPKREWCSRRRHLAVRGGMQSTGARRWWGPSVEASSPSNSIVRSRARSRQEARVPRGSTATSVRCGTARVPTPDARGVFGAASALLRACCPIDSSSRPFLRDGSLTTLYGISRQRTVRPWRSGVRCWAFARCARVSSWLQKPVSCVRHVCPGSWPSLGTRSSSRPRGLPSEQAHRALPVLRRWREGSREGAPGWWKVLWIVASPRLSRGETRKRSWSVAGRVRGPMTGAPEVSGVGSGRGQQPPPIPATLSEVGRAS